MTGNHLRTCPRCNRRFSVTLWQMHAHNPEQVHCSDAGCDERAVGYCADAPLQQGLEPLCGAHLVQHRRWGHDVRFVDGGVCTVCNGRGRGPDAEDPGGRWIRCSGCRGTGYASEWALSEQHRRAAERERERAEEEEARRREEEEDRERAQESTDEVSAEMEAGEQVAGQTLPETEEHQGVTEERPGEDRGEEEVAQQQGARREQEEVRPRTEARGRTGEAAGGSRSGSAERSGTHRREIYSDRSLDRHRCCCLMFLVLLIVGAGAGGYHYWPVIGQGPGAEPMPTPTATVPPTAEATPVPTPSPSPSPTPVPTSTPTPIPCADPTPTQPPIATPAPTATPTPGWPPQPLSEAWLDWARRWSRPEVNAALLESIGVFEVGLDGLEGLPKSDACAHAAAFEVHLEMARHLVDAHRLGNENVPGQHAGISWIIWLRFQRELLVEAVSSHAPVAECRNLLATPTPTAAAAPAPAPPGARVAPLSPCPIATPTPLPSAKPSSQMLGRAPH